MKAIPISDDWDSTSAYSSGDTVYYFGSEYRANATIGANPNGNDTPVEDSRWDFYRLIRIENYYSLQDAIRVAINTDSPIINNSIPLFIQSAENSINKILKSPAQIVTRVYNADSEGRIEIPNDILEVTHMRMDRDSTAAYTLRERGTVTIEAAVDKQEYERVKQYYGSRVTGFQTVGQVDYPVYWEDSIYYNIAPQLEEGTPVELSYRQQVPSLGEIVGEANENGEAVNSDGMTLQEWIDAGNSADTFVQATFRVVTNLWVLSIPQTLLYGSLIAAEAYLNNDDRMAGWRAAYDRMLVEATQQFEAYNSQKQRSQTMQSGYFKSTYF